MSNQAKIAELVEKYHQDATRRSLSEADVRAIYIDWLFYYLGWDVWKDAPVEVTRYHREGYQRGVGVIDVGLEIGGEPVLILEAKRFGAILRYTERSGDRTPEERQLFRYARSRKIPYGILTNFERLHVFNADHERLILHFDDPQEYLDRFSELERLYPDNVKTGSLPAWERQLEIKDIDETFLASLHNWRLCLANAIYKHNADNPSVKTDGDFDFTKLMAAVQRLLDRLILVRYADDKEVLLVYDILETILSSYRKKGAYAGCDHLRKEFIDLSHNMDEQHNTTLFQKGHICEQVFIPNEVLASIIEEMNNISFRKFSSDILGNTYESYLGTKLTLQNGKIESAERRDIRKSGGIYYTPTWVVRYILDNTLGTLLSHLEGKHGLRAIEEAKGINVLDPACGSGSFLIYAYQVFADFYRRMNRAIEEEQMELLASGATADMFERLEALKDLPQPVLDYPQHILREQLYGVDLDPEAAEIAAVNLTMQAFADTKREKLPLILNENIKVGNSLISGTEEELRRYFGDEWQEKKPFNWEKEFPEIMADGGFDVVIGNPPYLFGEYIDPSHKSYYKDNYQVAMGQYDIFWLFYEKCLQLLNKHGYHGYIVPDAMLVRDESQILRALLLERTQLKKIAHVGTVFPHSDVSSVIIVLHKSKEAITQNIVDIEQLRQAGQLQLVNQITQSGFLRHEKYALVLGLNEHWETVEQKLTRYSQLLGDFVSLSRGEEFGKRKLEKIQGEIPPRKVPILVGENIRRYWISAPVYLISQEKIAKPISNYQSPKILIVKTGERLVCAIDTENRYTLQSLYNIRLKTSCPYQQNYILAILNSTLMSAYLQQEVTSYKKLFPQINQGHILALPIRHIDFDNSEEKSKHDNLVALADKMLELNKRLAPIRKASSPEKDKLLQEIELTDRAIDRLVYGLYQLNEDEIKVIEEDSFGEEFAEAYGKLPTTEQAEALAEKRAASQQRQETLEQELERLKEIIIRQYQPERIYLFGSLAQGKVHPWSDIDLCIIKKTEVRFLDRLKEIIQLTDPRIAVSFTVYTPEEVASFEKERHYFWKDEIVAKGKVIYESS